MRSLMKNKQFYFAFLSMTLIIAMQNLITFAVNLADNVMIGRYSQDALSGVALVNQIQFLLQMMVMGIGNGIVVLGAQYWGKKQTEPIKKVTDIGMVLAIIVALAATTVTFYFPKQVLSLLTDVQPVIEEGARYLTVVCWSYLFFAITNILLFSLRSAETVWVGFGATTAALFVNVFLNYVLIYGKWGFPELGVKGAALATLASRVIEFLLVGSYALWVDKKIRWRPKYLFALDKHLFRDYLRVGLPLICSNTVWGIAMGVQTAILGHLGDAPIAANSIATTIFQVVTVVCYGSANASGVLIGKTVGEGNIPKVKVYTRKLQWIYLLIGLLTGLLLWSSKNWIIDLYQVTGETAKLAATFIGILSVTVIGTSYQVACLTGIVTGGGDTRFVLINDLIHQWLIVLPFSFLAAYVFQAPVWVTFFCLKSDQILKCFVAVIKVNRFGWIRNLTKE